MKLKTLRVKSQAKTCSSIVSIIFALALSACAAPSVTPSVGTPTASLSPAEGISQEATRPPTQQPQGTAALPPGQVHRATFAGTWYPGDPDELAQVVDEMLAAVTPVDGDPIALIVPHAGYVFSGPVAAYGFKQLEGKEYKVAIIIASDHQMPLSDPISVWTEGGFETPLGVAPVDVELAQALVEADPGISSDPAAFEGEHVIEIELPFLQRVCPDCRIVPVLMGAEDEETVRALANALLSALPGRRAVVIASSDLSHYPQKENALRVDGATLAAIETGNPAYVRDTIAMLMSAGIPGLSTCACGEGAILAAMRVAQGLRADTVTILRYANSADSPYGDAAKVVGYGAVMLWRYEPPDLTEAQQAELLELARTTIAEYLERGHIFDYGTGAVEADDSALSRRSGAFVTLKERGDPSTGSGASLRGCVGHMQANAPLYLVVQEMAVAAATSDPRFPPLKVEELDKISIEISVLSPLCRIIDVRQIEVGTHGLMIVKEGQRGVLLPQVPLEEGWDREEFLDNLCLKAGLPANCWQDKPALYAFTAVVFGEESGK